MSMQLKYDDTKHAYWLDGKRCKSITTVAKIPDDTYALEQWRKRQVVLGMALDPALHERAAAHHDDRGQLDRIAEEAMTTAKSHESADRGTAAHRIAERHDLGETIIDTPLARAVRTAWTKALDTAGLTIVPEYVERIVIYPDLRLAGRFDRIARRRSDNKLVVVDLKTGAGAVRYPHATAVQLALYANAPKLVGPLPGSGGTTDVIEQMVAVDLKWAYIVHMPSDAEVAVHKVDIAAGMEIARKSIFPVLDWRARKDLVREVGSTPIVNPERPASDERVAWIRSRLVELATTEQGKRLAVARWPHGVAPRPPWSEADIDRIDERLVTVERDAGASFADRDPAVAGMGRA